MANQRTIECPTCKGEGAICESSLLWSEPDSRVPCAACNGEGEIANPDYEGHATCCSGCATGGPSSCNRDLKIAENN